MGRWGFVSPSPRYVLITLCAFSLCLQEIAGDTFHTTDHSIYPKIEAIATPST